jgi:hypothetical protein
MKVGSTALPGCYLGHRRELELSLVAEPRPLGPIIGHLAGVGFAETVGDSFGRCFTYQGVMPRGPDGEFDLESLRRGEFIVQPGLLYRLEGTKPGPRKPWAAREHRILRAIAFLLVLLLSGTLLVELLSMTAALGAG